MFRMSYLLVCFLVFPNFVSAAVILKAKQRKALVQLEGVKTQKGAYFRVYDLDGEKKGLIKIQKISHSKAIGILKIGSMGKAWQLQPVSEKKAVAELNRLMKKKQRRAQLKRKILKRKLAQKKARQKQRLLAKKRQEMSRKVASFELEEDILDGLDSDNNQQSSEVLSYEVPIQSQEELFTDSFKQQEETKSYSKRKKSRYSLFRVGLSVTPQYNFIRVKLNATSLNYYTMRGLGGLTTVNAYLSGSPYIDVGVNLGYRYLFASANQGQCELDSGCSFLVHYLVAGGHLKLNLLELNQNKLWVKAGGDLLFPISYSNRSNIKPDFYPLHGTVGAGLGFDLNYRRFVIPISLEGSMFMPPGADVRLYSIGLNLGFTYKF